MTPYVTEVNCTAEKTIGYWLAFVAQLVKCQIYHESSEGHEFNLAQAQLWRRIFRLFLMTPYVLEVNCTAEKTFGHWLAFVAQLVKC